MKVDALVIGGGPAGAVCAQRLAFAGWSVVVVERQAFPRRKVCGECLAASNWPLLDALGVGAPLRALAGPALHEVVVAWEQDAVAAPLPARGNGPDRFGRVVARDVLDPLLLGAARTAGARVLQPAVVRAVRGQPGAFTCEVMQGGERVHVDARVVIAAHGSWQPGPTGEAEHAQRLRPPQRARDLLAFKATFRHSALTPGRLWVLALDGGYGGMVLGADGITTVACCVRRDRVLAARRFADGLPAAEAVRGVVLDRCASVRDALADAQPLGGWISAGPLRPGVHLPLRGGTHWRVGNAAGEAHPIIGEGMSMALQSAWLLADHLLINAARVLCDAPDPAVGRAYAAAWRQRFAPRIALAATLAHVAMRPALCEAALPLLRVWPRAITALASAGGKARCAVALSVAGAALPRVLNRVDEPAAPAPSRADDPGAARDGLRDRSPDPSSKRLANPPHADDSEPLAISRPR
jgi:menaquinone-9 beta-reductase